MKTDWPCRFLFSFPADWDINAEPSCWSLENTALLSEIWESIFSRFFFSAGSFVLGTSKFVVLNALVQLFETDLSCAGRKSSGFSIASLSATRNEGHNCRARTCVHMHVASHMHKNGELQNPSWLLEARMQCFYFTPQRLQCRITRLSLSKVTQTRFKIVERRKDKMPGSFWLQRLIWLTRSCSNASELWKMSWERWVPFVCVNCSNEFVELYEVWFVVVSAGGIQKKKKLFLVNRNLKFCRFFTRTLQMEARQKSCRTTPEPLENYVFLRVKCLDMEEMVCVWRVKLAECLIVGFASAHANQADPYCKHSSATMDEQ